MSDAVDELADLILDAMNDHDNRYGPSTFLGLAHAARDAVNDAGYRRVVVDDAMTERARRAYYGDPHYHGTDRMGAALAAALETDDRRPTAPSDACDRGICSRERGHKGACTQ